MGTLSIALRSIFTSLLRKDILMTAISTKFEKVRTRVDERVLIRSVRWSVGSKQYAYSRNK